MNLYYVENITHEGIEQFYLVETDYGCLELGEDGRHISYRDMEDFQSTWVDFDKNAIMVKVL